MTKSIGILWDDKNSTFLHSDLFSLKTHVFERKSIWKTGFETHSWEIDCYYNQILLTQ